MPDSLKRAIRTPGAILMGLGSIIGTGIFVSVAIATQVAGNGVLIAILIAALLATFNGLSSAQLAAAQPVSGGTYEYGNRFLNHWFGFSAGWMFLVAKSASAATAVIGCAGYLFYAFGMEPERALLAASGLALLLLVTLLVSGGIQRSNRANAWVVTATLAGLTTLVVAGLWREGLPVQPVTDALTDSTWRSILHASALMFVAYTGYGRIATLGEEVRDPRRTIPRAIILSMGVIIVIYLAVSMVALQVMDAAAFGETVRGEAAPLMVVAQRLAIPGLGAVVTVSAITAMLGVLLNLLLGLSRVMLGMARRRDLPEVLAGVHAESRSPVAAVWATGAVIGLFVLSGDMVFTWSFSAFTVLIYYAITNLSALFLPDELRLYPRWVPVMGLFGCLFLAFWIDLAVWTAGAALLLAGLGWHAVARRLF